MTSGSVVQNVRSKNVALTPIESCISILDLNLYIYLYIYIFFNLRSKQIKRSPWKISIWGRFLGHLQFFGQSSCLRNFFCELTFWTLYSLGVPPVVPGMVGKNAGCDHDSMAWWRYIYICSWCFVWGVFLKGLVFCLWFGNHIHFLMDLEWYQHFFSTKVLILSIFFKALNIWTWCFGYSTFANTIVFWLHCCGSKVHVWRLNFWRVVFGRWYQKTESFLSG